MTPALRQALLSRPGWVLPGASLHLDFANRRFWSGTQVRGWIDDVPGWAFTRSGADQLQADANGAYQAFPANVPAITAGVGLGVWEARTNLFLNSAAPVTQNITLGTGTYALSVVGSGSATSSAGTATGSGFGAATAGSANIFTVSGAGSVTITIAGSPTYVDVQAGAFATPPIITGAASATRAQPSALITGLGALLTPPFVVLVKAELGAFDTAAQSLFGLYTASNTSNQINARRNAGGNMTIGNSAGAGAGTFAAPGARTVRGAYRFRPTEVGATVDGASVASSGTTTLPAGLNAVSLGVLANGNNPLNGSISRLAIIPSDMGDAQLQALSASL